jgi:hypothetical protein
MADECWWKSRRLVVERLSLAFPDLPPGLEGLRMVQISDLHRSAVVGQREIEQAVARATSLAPDLMVLTGDYVTFDRGMLSRARRRCLFYGRRWGGTRSWATTTTAWVRRRSRQHCVTPA